MFSHLSVIIIRPIFCFAFPYSTNFVELEQCNLAGVLEARLSAAATLRTVAKYSVDLSKYSDIAFQDRASEAERLFTRSDYYEGSHLQRHVVSYLVQRGLTIISRKNSETCLFILG